jgi:hypothetical protein
MKHYVLRMLLILSILEFENSGLHAVHLHHFSVSSLHYDFERKISYYEHDYVSLWIINGESPPHRHPHHSDKIHVNQREVECPILDQMSPCLLVAPRHKSGVYPEVMRYEQLLYCSNISRTLS